MIDFALPLERAAAAKIVAYVYEGTGYGGVEVYVRSLVQNLDRRRYFPIVVLPSAKYAVSGSPRFLDDIQRLHVPILWPQPRNGSRAFGVVHDILQTAHIFKQAGVSVVHLQTSRCDSGRKATLAAKLAGVRAVLRTEHVPPSIHWRWFSRYRILPFDWMTSLIITDSDSDLAEQRNLLRRSPRKTYRSYCGIELEKFTPTRTLRDAKRHLGLDPEVPVVGTIGRLAEQKGHRYFVEAAGHIARRYGKVTYLLVGEGPLGDALTRQVKALGLEDRFLFTGFQAEYRPYMEAMDVAVMPSLYEGFSLTMLEMMAMGKPCVFTDHSSFQEAVTDGHSGLLVPVGSGEGLAEGILRLLRDPEFAAKLGEAARQRTQTAFSLPRLLDDMMGLYDRLLGEKSFCGGCAGRPG